MVILSYIIPKSLQSNDFVKSLHKQFEEKGQLSIRQTEALVDMLEIDLDFFEWDAKCLDENYQDDFEKLMAKMKRNRFRKVKTRNKCIRAIESIIEGKPRPSLIADALGENFQYRYRRYY